MDQWNEGSWTAFIGRYRESHQRDRFASIEKGNLPKGTLFVQIMPENEAFTVPYHPFDLTRVWPHQDYLLKVCDNRVCCGLSYRH